MDAEKLIIFDTTLRDGEQCPGASMTLNEKLEIAIQLEKLGVDVIEAGFAASSPSEVEAIKLISQKVQSSIICSLARSVKSDIEVAASALKFAQKSRIHTFISTSPLHMKYKLRMNEAEVIEAINSSVNLARNLCDDVEWSCEDGTRSDPQFLVKCFDTAIKAGATTVNIADTVGYILPDEFVSLINFIKKSVANIDKATFSVHCHDDLGLAVANSLAATKGGVRQVECTINGLGERAGNASLEEIVMLVKTRSDQINLFTHINSREITATSKLVSKITGFPVPPNKSVVGSNAFAHESGIHQHGVIKHPATYEIIKPEEVGANGTDLVLGKHSGKWGLLQKCRELGLDIGDNSLETLFFEFKKLAEKKFEITNDDLKKLVQKTF